MLWTESNLEGFVWSYRSITGLIECFHMTSQWPYWCPKTIKQWPCWCLKPIPWELNSFLMQMLSFVPINLHTRCWPRGHVSENILHLRDNLPRNASFWQVDLLDVVLSEYPDRSHNFTNLFFMHHTYLKSLLFLPQRAETHVKFSIWVVLTLFGGKLMKMGHKNTVNFSFWDVFKEQALLEKHYVLDEEGEAQLIQGQYLIKHYSFSWIVHTYWGTYSVTLLAPLWMVSEVQKPTDVCIFRCRQSS